LYGADLRGVSLSGADLSEVKDVYTFQGGVYNRLCFTYKFENTQLFQIGCFNGTYDEAIKQVVTKYGSNSRYEKILTAYEGIFND